MLICYFAAQETCILIINVGHSCAAQLFRGHEQKHDISMRGVWAALTEEFVGPAVERLARTQVFVFLVILHRTKVSQSPHEAPKVHLILTEIHETERETQKDFKLMLWFTLVVDWYVLISTRPDQRPTLDFTMFFMPQCGFFILHSNQEETNNPCDATPPTRCVLRQ